jgi:MFS family permease
MTAVSWSTGWILCAVQARASLVDAGVVVPLAAVLMGLGELFMAGALPSMVNALAPPTLRGRYNAALAFALTSGLWVSPLLTTAATALDDLASLFTAAVVALALMAYLTRPLKEAREPRVRGGDPLVTQGGAASSTRKPNAREQRQASCAGARLVDRAFPTVSGGQDLHRFLLISRRSASLSSRCSGSAGRRPAPSMSPVLDGRAPWRDEL